MCGVLCVGWLRVFWSTTNRIRLPKNKQPSHISPSPSHTAQSTTTQRFHCACNLSQTYLQKPCCSQLRSPKTNWSSSDKITVEVGNCSTLREVITRPQATKIKMDFTLLHKKLLPNWSAWTVTKSLSSASSLDSIQQSFSKLEKKTKMRVLLALLNFDSKTKSECLSSMNELLRLATDEEKNGKVRLF